MLEIRKAPPEKYRMRCMQPHSLDKDRHTFIMYTLQSDKGNDIHTVLVTKVMTYTRY